MAREPLTPVKIYQKYARQLTKKLKGLSKTRQIKTLKSIAPDIAEQVLFEQYSKWRITRLTEKDLGSLSIKERNKYIKREQQMLTGYYEQKRDRIWKANMYKALTKAGVSEELKDKFLELATPSKIKELSHDLDNINAWYPLKGVESDKDSVDAKAQKIYNDIRNGRYNSVKDYDISKEQESIKRDKIEQERISEMIEEFERVLGLYDK